MNNRILLVEDDQSFGAVLKDYLTINNFEVTLAIDGELGLKEFTEKEFDIVLNIIHLPKDVRNIKRSRLMFIVNDDLPGFIQKEKNDKSPNDWLFKINNRH